MKLCKDCRYLNRIRGRTPCCGHPDLNSSLVDGLPIVTAEIARSGYGACGPIAGLFKLSRVAWFKRVFGKGE